jgi:hypothetical protein
MAIFTPPIEIWLLRTERALRQDLDAGDKPFLGLYSHLFRDDTRDRIRTSLAGLTAPFAGLLRALQAWPAVFSSYLTVHVAEGYGAHGDAAVWPFIAAAILGPSKNFSTAEQDRLWQAYRKACIRLGLDVVPAESVANYRVTEFLHQAGMPVLYAPDLTRRMLRLAGSAGVPETDDPRGIALWQSTLVERLGPPVPLTVKRAIEADTNGYYARLFLRLLGEGGTAVAETETAIGAVMAEAIQAQGPMRTQGLLLPRVVWRDDWLGVELPPGDGALWTIAIDGTAREYRGSAEARFVPFDCPPLPGQAQVARGDGALDRAFPLWEDGRNNRFLAFDAAGVLCGSGRLAADVPLSIDPGPVSLVTRFRPDDCLGEVTEIAADPVLYSLTVTLAPGEALTLRRGPAEARLVARSQPTLSLSGTWFRGVGGNLLYASRGLRLSGQVPSELLADTAGGLTLVLSAPGLGAEAETAVTPDTDGNFVLDVEPITQGFTPGVARLGVELRRTGVRRPMARLAAYLWQGLEAIEERARFRYRAMPANLALEQCDNVADDQTRLEIGFRSDTKRFFRLVFILGTGRSVQFTGAVPGAFMVLKRFGDGQVTETPVRNGSMLAVRSASMEVLEVYSSQGGTLTLGHFLQEIPPGPGMRRLHLSALAEYLEPGQNRLWIHLPSCPAEPLLGLVTPHQVLGQSTTTQGGLMAVELTLPAPAEGMRCTAEDVLSDRTLDLDLRGNDAGARLDRTTLAWLTCGERGTDGAFRHTLELPLERWQQGAWLVSVEVRLQGRWGALVNERDDAYAWGALIDETGALAHRHWALARIATLTREEVTATFKRVHRALLICYAPDAWHDIAWLDALWHRLARGFTASTCQTLTELVALDALGSPMDAQASWFPLLGIGANLPWIYAQGSIAYRGLGGRGGLIGTLSLLHAPLCELFIRHELEQTLAFGFGNVMQIQRGTPPRGFSLKRYRAALAARNIDDAWSQLSREDWRPTPGDWLGPVHWRYALNAMQRRYHATLQGNTARRGWAMQLVCRLAPLSLADLAYGIPAHLDDVSGLGLMMPMPPGGWNQEQQNLRLMDHLLCLFAAVCRWEPRGEGALAAWQQNLCRVPLPDHEAVTLAMGYLLHVGREVFEFYLLLWELVFAADADVA